MAFAKMHRIYQKKGAFNKIHQTFRPNCEFNKNQKLYFNKRIFNM